MAFPAQYFYSILDVAGRWGCTQTEVINYAMSDEVNLVAGFSAVKFGTECAAGLMNVPGSEVRALFRNYGKGAKKIYVTQARQLPGEDCLPYRLARVIWDCFRRTEADFQDFSRQSSSRPPLDHRVPTGQGGGKRHHLGEFGGMFFTRIGKVIAYLIFLLGILRVAMGFLGAFGSADIESNRAFASRYLSAATTGEAINEGMMYILLAVALGVLCEISSKRNKPDEQA